MTEKRRQTKRCRYRKATGRNRLTSTAVHHNSFFFPLFKFRQVNKIASAKRSLWTFFFFLCLLKKCRLKKKTIHRAFHLFFFLSVSFPFQQLHEVRKYDQGMAFILLRDNKGGGCTAIENKNRCSNKRTQINVRSVTGGDACISDSRKKKKRKERRKPHGDHAPRCMSLQRIFLLLSTFIFTYVF